MTKLQTMDEIFAEEEERMRREAPPADKLMQMLRESEILREMMSRKCSRSEAEAFVKSRKDAEEAQMDLPEDEEEDEEDEEDEEEFDEDEDDEE